MRLRQLRFLVAVYEEGSFTAAASRMHATQSGVSAQIKQLEDSLQAQLFERTANGVMPTAAGTLAYQRAVRVLRETNAMTSDIAAMQAGVTGTVSAGLMPTTTRSVIAPVLENFAIRYPEVEIRIEEAYSAHLCAGVAAGRLDFALVPPTSPVPGLKTTHVASDVEVFVTAPGQQRDHMSAVDLTSLAPFKLVLPGPDNARRATIEQRIETFNLPVTRIIELDAMMATLDLVARSDWTAILPGCLVISDVHSTARSLHPIHNPAMSLDYVLIEQASASPSPAARLLSEALQAEVQQVCRSSSSIFL